MISLQGINIKQTHVYQDALIKRRQDAKQEGQLTIILHLLVWCFGNSPESLFMSL